MRVIIYGAVSEPIEASSTVSKLKLRTRQMIHAYRDIKNLKQGNASLINYKNHDYKTSTNIGDIAITETVAKYFLENDLEASIQYCNWNNLKEFNRNNPITPSDWIIIPGGGYFMFPKGNEIASRIASDIDIFETTKANVVLFGVGVNRPDDATKGDLVPSSGSIDCIKRLLNHTRLVSVRDRYSKELLEKFTNKPIELIGDPALHLASQLGICQPPPDHTVSNEIPAIGLNFSFHGPTSNFVLQKNIYKYIYFLKNLQLTTGCIFFYFVHYESGLLIPKLLASSGIHTTVVYGKTTTLLNAYKNLDLHIGGMLHSCIFSYSVNTPAIGLAYDIKHIGFFELFDSPENCLSVFDFDGDLLLQRARKILSDGDSIRKNIVARRIQLEELTRDFAARTLAEIRKDQFATGPAS